MQPVDGEAVPSLASAPLLLQRYRPLSLIAQGGMSSVFLGRDESIGRDVAIKLFSAGGDADIVRFREELRVLATLSHHGVVAIVDAGIDDSSPHDIRPFLIMELVRGATLRTRLAEGPLSPRAIGGIAFEVAEALDYVHSRGVVHRDIGPSNIMITDYGTRTARPRARITDFGIAIDARSAPETVSTVVTGTAAYMSPEQVSGGVLSFSTDIYALGLVLLECFTREVEFSGGPADSAVARLERDPVISPSVPKAWAQLIRSMTARNPVARPSAADVAETARAILAKQRR